MQKLRWSVGNGRTKLIGQKLRIGSHMFAVNKQPLPHSHFGEIRIHVLEGRFKLSIQLWSGKRNRLHSLSVFSFLPQRHTNQDPFMLHLFAASHESRPVTEDDEIAFLLLLNYCQALLNTGAWRNRSILSMKSAAEH